MKDLIKLEYKKLWNGVSIVSIAALSILTVLFSVVTLNIQQRTVDKNGNIVTGLSAFRTLKEEAKDLEGVMDGEYIQNLIEEYNSSPEKAFLDSNRGFLGTGGMTKYIITNYVINYAYFSLYMTNGNENMRLDYEFLNSEESFYQKFKDAIMEQQLYVNKENGVFQYTDAQIEALQKKVDNLKTPFKVAYHTGLGNLNSYYGMEYPVFFIVLAFCLASVYAKDSMSGIDELALSSKHGRKKDMKARWIAGNLFALTAYLCYVGVLVVVHGVIGSLHGLDASAQTFWFDCIFNISVGTGLLFIFFGGLAGALVMANIVLLLSVGIKNSKAAAVAGIAVVLLLRKGTDTYSQIKLLDPIGFGGSESAYSYLMVGTTIVPYFVVVLLLSIVYVAALWLAMRMSYKKYYIN